MHLYGLVMAQMCPFTKKTFDSLECNKLVLQMALTQVHPAHDLHSISVPFCLSFVCDLCQLIAINSINFCLSCCSLTSILLWLPGQLVDCASLGHALAHNVNLLTDGSNYASHRVIHDQLTL